MSRASGCRKSTENTEQGLCNQTPQLTSSQRIITCGTDSEAHSGLVINAYNGQAAEGTRSWSHEG